MCPDVLFHGEYVDKDWLNRWLQNPENQLKIDELEAKEKAEDQERKKQLQKQKRAETQLKEKKVQEYLHKFRANFRQTLCCQKNRVVNFPYAITDILVLWTQTKQFS